MRKHPRSALLFVYVTDVVALFFAAYAVKDLLTTTYTSTTWMHFVIWAAILSIARLSGLIEFIGMKVSSGVAVAIEFAAVIVLPFPFLCLAIFISLLVNIFDRVRKKHPEPFIGPDFNASTVIIAGLCAQLLNDYLIANYLSKTLALLPTALLFSVIQVLMLTVLLSLDLRKPWNKVGTLSYDSLGTEAVFITSGALVGRIYQLDYLLIGLTFLPIIFLQQALKRFNEAKLAYVDAKTGVYNYRYFDEKYVDLFGRAVQTKEPLALIFSDMDHLRDINNTHGHQVGDIAITSVAKALMDEAGDLATVARFGGEEFVIILPKHTTMKAAIVAEKLRLAVEKIKIPLEDGETLKVTVSLGVASYPADAKDSDELIKAADSAVYAAKHAGRNQVKSYIEAS